MPLRLFFVLFVSMITSATFAQEFPAATKHHEALKKDVGTWTATMKMFVGPEMPAMPVTETNRLLPGGLWLVSEFESGPFKGHGVFGYDATAKKHIGIWVDN